MGGIFAAHMTPIATASSTPSAPRAAHGGGRAVRLLAALLAGVALVILFGSLAYPDGYDQAVFRTGGRMILQHGAIPYRDLLDTKPPLIFYTYALAEWVFGATAIAPRALECLALLASGWVLYRLMQEVASRAEALLIAALMVISVTALGFWHTAQAETFTILPSLLTLRLLYRAERGERTLWRGVAIGLLTALLALFKYTLILGPLVGLIFVTRRRGSERHGRGTNHFIIGAIVGLALAASAYVAWMAKKGALTQLHEALLWTSRYAAITSEATGRSLWVQALWLMPKSLLYHATPTIIALVVLGVIARRRGDEAQQELHRLFLLTAIGQLVGILLERKVVFGYQYARVLWALAPLAGVGLIEAIAFARRTLAEQRTMLRIGATVVILCAGVMLSPLARLGTQTIPFAQLALTGESTASAVEQRIPTYFAAQQAAVAQALRGKLAPTDELFVWGNDIGIYLLAGRLPTTICLTATPLRTSWTPPAWRRSVMRSLTAHPPARVVVEFGDADPAITGSAQDSRESLASWPELDTYLRTTYRPDTIIGHFALLKRNDLR